MLYSRSLLVIYFIYSSVYMLITNLFFQPPFPFGNHNQYFGHLMWRVDSLEKTLMLGGIGGRRRRGWQRMGWLDSITDSMDVSLSEVRVLVMDREAWSAAINGVTKSQTRLSDWTELNWVIVSLKSEPSLETNRKYRKKRIDLIP